jgi:hypothetical protein
MHRPESKLGQQIWTSLDVPEGAALPEPPVFRFKRRVQSSFMHKAVGSLEVAGRVPDYSDMNGNETALKAAKQSIVKMW